MVNYERLLEIGESCKDKGMQYATDYDDKYH